MSNPEFNRFSKENSCSLCPIGQFGYNGDNDDTSCQICPSGKKSLAGSTSCVEPLPDGCKGADWDDRSCDIRKAVDDLLSQDPTKISNVINKYGPMQYWDVSQITNLQNLFYRKKTFNVDISRWITSRVTMMQGSKFYITL